MPQLSEENSQIPTLHPMRPFRMLVVAMALLLLPRFGGSECAFAQNAPDAAAADNANTALPGGFKPPGKPPAAMNIVKPLITAEEVAAYKRDTEGYLAGIKAIAAGKRNEQIDKKIEELARWYVYRMTLPEEVRALPSLRTEIIRTIRLNAKGETRFYYIEQIAKRCEELFDGNFHVRLNAVVLLTELNSEDPPLKANPPPAVPYIPASRPLLKVIADPDQLDAIKVPATVGLIRISLFGKPDNAVPRVEIAQVCNAELQRADIHSGYQIRLIETLAAAGVPSSNPAQQDFDVVKTLIKIVYDKQAHWLVRSAAARAFGRIPTGNGETSGNALFGVVKLGDEMVAAYNQNSNRFYWKLGFFNLYLAFKPLDDKDPARQGGLLDRFSGGSREVVTAYESLLPAIQHVINSPKNDQAPATISDSMKKWLSDNAASNYQPKTAVDPATSQGTPTPNGEEPKPASAGP